jgi:hypothetical protein
MARGQRNFYGTWSRQSGTRSTGSARASLRDLVNVDVGAAGKMRRTTRRDASGENCALYSARSSRPAADVLIVRSNQVFGLGAPGEGVSQTKWRANRSTSNKVEFLQPEHVKLKTWNLKGGKGFAKPEISRTQLQKNAGQADFGLLKAIRPRCSAPMAERPSPGARPASRHVHVSEFDCDSTPATWTGQLHKSCNF